MENRQGQELRAQVKTSVFYRVVNVVFAALFFGVVLLSIFNNQSTAYTYSTPLLFLSAMVGVALVFGASRLFSRIPAPSKVAEIASVSGGMVLFTVLCFVVGFSLAGTPDAGSDFGMVYSRASAYALGGTLPDNYFLYYPTQSGFYVLLCGIFSFFKLLGVTNFMTPLVIINTLAVCGAVLLMYFCARRLFGVKKALFILVGAVFTVPFLLSGAVAYTYTLTLPVPVAVMLLWMKTRGYWRNGETKRAIINFMILSGIAAVGGLLKLTVLVVYLAVLIDMLILLGGRGKLKLLGAGAGVCAAVFLLGSLLISASAALPDYDREADGIPLSSWIMMGLSENGSDSQADLDLILSHPDKDARDDYVGQEITDRIGDYMPFGIFTHLGNKLAYTFGDPTLGLAQQLGTGSTGLRGFFLPGGSGFAAMSYFAFGIQMAVLAWAAVAAAKALYRKNDALTFARLAMLGLVVFLLFWKTEPGEIVLFVPVFLLCGLEASPAPMLALQKKRAREALQTNVAPQDVTMDVAGDAMDSVGEELGNNYDQEWAAEEPLPQPEQEAQALPLEPLEQELPQAEPQDAEYLPADEQNWADQAIQEAFAQGYDVEYTTEDGQVFYQQPDGRTYYIAEDGQAYYYPQEGEEGFYDEEGQYYYYPDGEPYAQQIFVDSPDGQQVYYQDYYDLPAEPYWDEETQQWYLPPQPGDVQDVQEGDEPYEYGPQWQQPYDEPDTAQLEWREEGVAEEETPAAEVPYAEAAETELAVEELVAVEETADSEEPAEAWLLLEEEQPADEQLVAEEPQLVADEPADEELIDDVQLLPEDQLFHDILDEDALAEPQDVTEELPELEPEPDLEPTTELTPELTLWPDVPELEGVEEQADALPVPEEQTEVPAAVAEDAPVQVQEWPAAIDTQAVETEEPLPEEPVAEEPQITFIEETAEAPLEEAAEVEREAPELEAEAEPETEPELTPELTLWPEVPELADDAEAAATVNIFEEYAPVAQPEEPQPVFEPVTEDAQPEEAETQELFELWPDEETEREEEPAAVAVEAQLETEAAQVESVPAEEPAAVAEVEYELEEPQIVSEPEAELFVEPAPEMAEPMAAAAEDTTGEELVAPPEVVAQPEFEAEAEPMAEPLPEPEPVHELEGESAPELVPELTLWPELETDEQPQQEEPQPTAAWEPVAEEPAAETTAPAAESFDDLFGGLFAEESATLEPVATPEPIEPVSTEDGETAAFAPSEEEYSFELLPTTEFAEVEEEATASTAEQPAAFELFAEAAEIAESDYAEPSADAEEDLGVFAQPAMDIPEEEEFEAEPAAEDLQLFPEAEQPEELLPETEPVAEVAEEAVFAEPEPEVKEERKLPLWLELELEEALQKPRETAQEVDVDRLLQDGDEPEEVAAEEPEAPEVIEEEVTLELEPVLDVPDEVVESVPDVLQMLDAELERVFAPEEVKENEETFDISTDEPEAEDTAGEAEPETTDEAESAEEAKKPEHKISDEAVDDIIALLHIKRRNEEKRRLMAESIEPDEPVAPAVIEDVQPEEAVAESEAEADTAALAEPAEADPMDRVLSSLFSEEPEAEQAEPETGFEAEEAEEIEEEVAAPVQPQPHVLDAQQEELVQRALEFATGGQPLVPPAARSAAVATQPEPQPVYQPEADAAAATIQQPADEPFQPAADLQPAADETQASPTLQPTAEQPQPVAAPKQAGIVESVLQSLREPVVADEPEAPAEAPVSEQVAVPAIPAMEFEDQPTERLIPPAPVVIQPVQPAAAQQAPQPAAPPRPRRVVIQRVAPAPQYPAPPVDEVEAILQSLRNSAPPAHIAAVAPVQPKTMIRPVVQPAPQAPQAAPQGQQAFRPQQPVPQQAPRPVAQPTAPARPQAQSANTVESVLKSLEQTATFKAVTPQQAAQPAQPQPAQASQPRPVAPPASPQAPVMPLGTVQPAPSAEPPQGATPQQTEDWNALHQAINSGLPEDRRYTVKKPTAYDELMKIVDHAKPEDKPQ